MEDMYGLMNYDHEQVQPTDSFNNRPDIRHKRTIPIGFGSASIILNSSSSNSNRVAEDLEEELSKENRSKIKSHPLYPKLLQAYIACQKVGAPPDIANLFDEIFRDNDFSRRSSACSCLGDNPELDEFMETYCEMLERYRSDLARPFDEATTFFNNMQNQLRNLCKGTCLTYHTGQSLSYYFLFLSMLRDFFNLIMHLIVMYTFFKLNLVIFFFFSSFAGCLEEFK